MRSTCSRSQISSSSSSSSSIIIKSLHGHHSPALSKLANHNQPMEPLPRPSPQITVEAFQQAQETGNSVSSISSSTLSCESTALAQILVSKGTCSSTPSTRVRRSGLQWADGAEERSLSCSSNSSTVIVTSAFSNSSSSSSQPVSAHVSLHPTRDCNAHRCRRV